MRCQDIMKTDVHCLNPNNTIREAAARMRDVNVGFLPVCGEDRKVLGVVTDRDITVRVVAEGLPTDARVDTCTSTSGLCICRPDDELVKVEELMCNQHVSRVLCCDDGGRLVGVVSLSDIAQFDEAANAANTMRRVSEREVRIQ